jgi:hypothetical protein
MEQIRKKVLERSTEEDKEVETKTELAKCPAVGLVMWCFVSHGRENWEQGRTAISGPALKILKSLFEEAEIEK